MRIEQLEIEGFGPFADAQHVDFAALDDAGLFLITGRTGSGKSSILDAVCFALYGRAPRYDGGELRIRSDHVDADTPTRVELVFSAGGERWRVARSPEYARPKRRGEGTTTQKELATLERWADGAWQGVAARAVDVAEALAPVLQLTREQFLQVILLAQGRFQEFLRAKSEDRVSLLRALFGTERFQRIEAELTDRAKALAEVVGAAGHELDAELARLGDAIGLPPGADGVWAAGAADTAAGQAAAAVAAEIAARAAFQDADTAAARAVAVAEAQRRRADARAQLARLDARAAELAALTRRRDDAVRVLPVLGALDRLEAAERAEAAALPAVDRAAAAVAGEVPDARAAVEAADAALGALEGPRRDEAALPGLRSAVAAARADRDDATVELAAAEALAAALPERRTALLAQREPAVRAAAEVPSLEASLAAERRIAAAARSAVTLTASAEGAAARLIALLDAEQAAGRRVQQLVASRYAGAAAALAARLVDGDPCPVCGAAQHPAPAAADAEPIGDGLVAEAQQAQARAVDERAAAAGAESALRAELAASRVACLGRDVAAADAAVAVAASALRAAQTIGGGLPGIDDALARLADDERGLADRTAAARTALTVAENRVATVLAALEDTTARVAQARGDAESVAARAVALTRRRQALAALVDAIGAAAAASAERDAAGRAFAAQLAEAQLTDRAAVRPAALSRGDREAIERRLAEATDARAAATATLADAAVATAPDAPADVDGTADAKRQALAAMHAGADARADAASRARRAAASAAAVRAIEARIAADRAQLDVIGPLAQVVRGEGANDRRMRLESYVLAARLEEIVLAANARLAEMPSVHFTLQHDDAVGYRRVRSGLGLEVFDEWTGRARPIASLSGGETFLAALALALGLAEVVAAEAGGVRLDTLFIDEGFGSLDRETLDEAMATLDSLRAGGRVVGLISHVETMQEDVPAGLHVERTPEGPSRIRLRVPV